MKIDKEITKTTSETMQFELFSETINVINNNERKQDSAQNEGSEVDEYQFAHDAAIFVRGSNEKNPGKGGYGIIISQNGKERTYSKGFEKTTNNRLELMGVIDGLETLTKRSRAQILTSSKYVTTNVNTNTLKKWSNNNWKKIDKKKDIMNKDLWTKLFVLINFHSVAFHFVVNSYKIGIMKDCKSLATNSINDNMLYIDSGYERKIKNKKSRTKQRKNRGKKIEHNENRKNSNFSRKRKARVKSSWQ